MESRRVGGAVAGIGLLRGHLRWHVLTVLAALAGIASCGGDGSTEVPPPPPPPPAQADLVAVSPASAVLDGPGGTVQLSAEVFSLGRPMVGEPVAWLSGDVSVATVDGSGLVTAVSVGHVTITASSGNARGSAEVNVVEPADLDRTVLAVFYEATGGPDWVNNES